MIYDTLIAKDIVFLCIVLWLSGKNIIERHFNRKHEKVIFSFLLKKLIDYSALGQNLKMNNHISMNDVTVQFCSIES